MPPYFDAHCHLQDDQLRPRVADAIERARVAGVRGVVCCGTSEKDWADVASIARANGAVVPAFGLHPWQVTEKSDQWLLLLKEYLLTFPRAGVGEIGLDHQLDPSTFREQADVFTMQMRLANELNRVISVHCRKAWRTLADIVKKTGVKRGVIHSYSGAAELIPTLEREGFHLSFSGSVTYEKNKRARESLKAVTPERLLIETDSPAIMPQGAESGVNEPANIVLVARAAARIRQVSVDEICQLTCDNGRRLFGEEAAP